MLDAAHQRLAAHAARSATRSADLDQPIARQAATIQAIAQRVLVAAQARGRGPVPAVHHDLAIAQDLATARAARGARRYDRHGATAHQAGSRRRMPGSTVSTRP